MCIRDRTMGGPTLPMEETYFTERLLQIKVASPMARRLAGDLFISIEFQLYLQIHVFTWHWFLYHTASTYLNVISKNFIQSRRHHWSTQVSDLPYKSPSYLAALHGHAPTHSILYLTKSCHTIPYLAFHTIPYHTIPYHTIYTRQLSYLRLISCDGLHYTTLHYTTLHYTTLHYTILHYNTLHYTTL